MLKPIVTFGEIMLRLAPPGLERFLQSPAIRRHLRRRRSQRRRRRVATRPARRLCHRAARRHPIADAAVGELRRFGVDTSRIVRGKGRHGHLLPGSGRQSARLQGRLRPRRQRHRARQARRHRLGRSASTAPAGSTSPASRRPSAPSAAELSLESVRKAREKGLTVSCDLNYRKNLWKYGKTAAEVMRELVQYVDIAIANEEDVQMALGIQAERRRALRRTGPRRSTRSSPRKVLDAYPQMKAIAITLRESHSASHNGWAACMNDRNAFHGQPALRHHPHRGPRRRRR